MQYLQSIILFFKKNEIKAQLIKGNYLEHIIGKYNIKLNKL